MDMGIEIVVRLVALLLAALATGGLMVNWIGLSRAMARMSSAAAYTEFHQATNRTFDPYMPIVVSGAIVGGVALVAVSPGVRSAPGWLAISGAVNYAAVIAITLSTNLPTNKAIAGWSVQSPPDNWRAVRAGWIRWHILRTLVSVPGLVCYILSGLLSAR
jgi:asparagine N-glycosylation enzyme membrane subunit Stt3